MLSLQTAENYTIGVTQVLMAKTKRRRPGNPVQFIKREHENLRRLFRAFQTGDDIRRKSIAEKALLELASHFRIESELLYPIVRNLSAKDEEAAKIGFEEHETIKKLAAELGVMRPEDKNYQRKFVELAEIASIHMKREEQEILLDLEDRLAKEEYSRLGIEMRELKSEVSG